MAITVAVERLLELRPIRLQMHKKLRLHPREFAALAHRNRRWLRTCHRGRKECGESILLRTVHIRVRIYVGYIRMHACDLVVLNVSTCVTCKLKRRPMQQQQRRAHRIIR